MALTATATENVREDIVRFLGLRDPELVAGSPHRANLAFEVLESRGEARLRALIRFARRLRRPGIIYCSTTREVDNVYTGPADAAASPRTATTARWPAASATSSRRCT